MTPKNKEFEYFSSNHIDGNVLLQLKTTFFFHIEDQELFLYKLLFTTPLLHAPSASLKCCPWRSASRKLPVSIQFLIKYYDGEMQVALITQRTSYLSV